MKISHNNIHNEQATDQIDFLDFFLNARKVLFPASSLNLVVLAFH